MALKEEDAEIQESIASVQKTIKLMEEATQLQIIAKKPGATRDELQTASDATNRIDSNVGIKNPEFRMILADLASNDSNKAEDIMKKYREALHNFKRSMDPDSGPGGMRSPATDNSATHAQPAPETASAQPEDDDRLKGIKAYKTQINQRMHDVEARSKRVPGYRDRGEAANETNKAILAYIDASAAEGKTRAQIEASINEMIPTIQIGIEKINAATETVRSATVAANVRIEKNKAEKEESTGLSSFPPVAEPTTPTPPASEVSPKEFTDALATIAGMQKSGGMLSKDEAIGPEMKSAASKVYNYLMAEQQKTGELSEAGRKMLAGAAEMAGEPDLTKVQESVNAMLDNRIAYAVDAIGREVGKGRGMDDKKMQENAQIVYNSLAEKWNVPGGLSASEKEMGDKILVITQPANHTSEEVIIAAKGLKSSFDQHNNEVTQHKNEVNTAFETSLKNALLTERLEKTGKPITEEFSNEEFANFELLKNTTRKEADSKGLAPGSEKYEAFMVTATKMWDERAQASTDRVEAADVKFAQAAAALVYEEMGIKNVATMTDDQVATFQKRVNAELDKARNSARGSVSETNSYVALMGVETNGMPIRQLELKDQMAVEARVRAERLANEGKDIGDDIRPQDQKKINDEVADNKSTAEFKEREEGKGREFLELSARVEGYGTERAQKKVDEANTQVTRAATVLAFAEAGITDPNENTKSHAQNEQIHARRDELIAAAEQRARGIAAAAPDKKDAYVNALGEGVGIPAGAPTEGAIVAVNGKKAYNGVNREESVTLQPTFAKPGEMVATDKNGAKLAEGTVVILEAQVSEKKGAGTQEATKRVALTVHKDSLVQVQQLPTGGSAGPATNLASR